MTWEPEARSEGDHEPARGSDLILLVPTLRVGTHRSGRSASPPRAEAARNSGREVARRSQARYAHARAGTRSVRTGAFPRGAWERGHTRPARGVVFALASRFGLPQKTAPYDTTAT